MNKIPNPTKISANSFTLGFFTIAPIKIPVPIAIGAHWERLKETIWPVIVVPILAPKITPTACWIVIIPAFTKPTTITDVALELWITVVTNIPTKTAIKRFFVNVRTILFSLSPANFCNPSAINFIPYKNKLKPATAPKNISKYMVFLTPLLSIKF